MIQSIIIIYLLVILIAGFWKRSETDTESFLFAGRKLTLPAFVATLVTTWYGGILEVGRVSFEHGISTWVIFGVFYYLAGFIFLKWIAPRISALNIRTIPEFIHLKYGKWPGVLAALFVLLLASPAPYIKMAGGMFTFIFHLPEFWAIVMAAGFSIVYAFSGGFQSVVRTDKLQFILMFGGFGMILIMLVRQYGGTDFLLTHTPDYAFDIPGNFSWSYILIWGFIAMMTFIDPGFYQRCYAGNSDRTVRRGILISIGFWIIFDMMSVMTGIYALAILPAGSDNAYLALAETVLSPVFRGIFFVALLSIIMSTIDSYTFISAFTIGKDIPQLFNPTNSERSRVNLVRSGLVITGIIAIIIASRFTHVLDIWYTMGTFAVPVLLIPIIGAMYNQKIKYPLLVMVFPLFVSGVWYAMGMANSLDGWPQYPLSIEPMYPGLLASGALFYILRKNR
ncbi:MAG: sodium:solute symporter family protein [Candidatus Marinimicrobia bacterium]|nr:sodium:solute symporter family protein [Candidatus Neomarinimicrobiota bacterium]